MTRKSTAIEKNPQAARSSIAAASWEHSRQAAGTSAVRARFRRSPAAEAGNVHFTNPPGLGGAGVFAPNATSAIATSRARSLDIDGAFYRVGPDWQYPPMQGKHPFDGEGHVSIFRIQTATWTSRPLSRRTPAFTKAQAAARAAFLRMYRNKFTGRNPSRRQMSAADGQTRTLVTPGLLFA